MNFLKKIFTKKKILVTHNGSFHADDLFASAVLSILNNEKVKIVRTRDPKIISSGDYVYDVGGIYDPEKNLFDHHQKGGAGNRENGIPYSSFGLVWKTYGEKLCGSKEVADKIDHKIVQPIDALDNGVDISIPKFDGVFSYGAEQIFLAFSPTWQEDGKNIDDVFMDEVKDIIKILKREITVAKSDYLGKEIILKAYEDSKDKKIIILDNPFPRYLIQNTLSVFSEPLYFIYPSNHSEFWKVEAIKENSNTMKSRKLFPEEWRGLMHGNPKLSEMTGVKDFKFCHASGFFLTVKSKEGAIKLAELALTE